MTTKELLARPDVPAVYKDKYFKDEIDEQEFCEKSEKALGYLWEATDRHIDDVMLGQK